MADYIYLLDHRLSTAQRAAVRTVRELARSRSLTVFLVGGAVRDLTSGSPVRDLDIVVQGNALKLKKDLQAAGATVTGENEAGQALFLSFAGSVRMELGSTLSVSYPKPGKPVYKPSGIQDDLRRRDFTANAMALSLNEGSYGLLMDPLNGIADIENRELRLVSNYGFIEEPVRMVRAARLMARLGWAMDEKTQQRYETGKSEEYIGTLSSFHLGYELEEIIHEEDPLRILKRLESEGWMKYLAPYWTSAKVNTTEVEHLRELQTKLQMQGIHPDPSPANFPLLTAKLTPAEVAKLKASFPRQGFVTDVDSLEARAKELAAQLNSKAAALPSHAWKIISEAAPEVLLWLMFSTRSAALQAKFNSFTSTWPQARQKIPYALMQEMRIVPELPGYDELVENLFFELMDDKLQTTEEMKAFLEPYSPPAPPPPVNVRRARAAKKEPKASKARAKKAVIAADDDEESDSDDDSEELDDSTEDALELPEVDEEEIEGDVLPPDDEEDGTDDPDETEEDDEEEEDDAIPAPSPKSPAKPKQSKAVTSESHKAPPIKTVAKAIHAEPHWKAPAPAVKVVAVSRPAGKAAHAVTGKEALKSSSRSVAHSAPAKKIAGAAKKSAPAGNAAKTDSSAKKTAKPASKKAVAAKKR